MGNSNTLDIKQGVESLASSLQQNADAIADAVEERETIRYAPVPACDIRKRFGAMLDRAASRYMRGEKVSQNLNTVSNSTDCSNLELGHFINKVIHRDGAPIPVLDTDALAFLFRPQLDTAFGNLTKEIDVSNAGLPQEERAQRISELDTHIEQLEEEQQALYQQAADAGLVVTEEYK